MISFILMDIIPDIFFILIGIVFVSIAMFGVFFFQEYGEGNEEEEDEDVDEDEDYDENGLELA